MRFLKRSGLLLKPSKSGVLLLLFCLFPLGALGQAGPPAHEKHMYRGPNGKLYTPLDLPVYLHISTNPGGAPSSPPYPPYPPAEKPPVPMTEGLNVLRKTGTQTAYRVYADGTAPLTTAILAQAPRYVKKKQVYYGEGLVLTIDTRDALSGVKETYFSMNGLPFQPLQFPFSQFDAVPEHHLRYYSVDNVGNVEPMRETRFFHDLRPPGTGLQVTDGYTDDNGGNFLSPRSTVSLAAEDDLSGVNSIYYRFGKGKNRKYKKKITPRGLDEGTHLLHYFSEDCTANRETEKIYRFHHDGTPPRVSVRVAGEQYKAGDTLFAAGGSNLCIDADDNGAGTAEITYRTGKGKPQPYGGPIRLPEQSGNHKIRFAAVDNLGNRAGEKMTKVYMDLEPPGSAFQLSGSYFKRAGDYIIRGDTNVFLTASDLESGIKALQYRVAGGGWKVYKDPLSFPDNGEYTLTYFAVDRVNNREKEKTLSLVVDNALASDGFGFPPSPHPRQWYPDEKDRLTGPAGFPFYLLISPGEEGGPVFLLDLKKMAEESGKPVTFKKGGTNRLRISAGDRDESFFLGIDDSPPRTRAVFTGAVRHTGGGTLYCGPGLSIELSARDNPKGIVSGNRETRVAVNDSAFAVYTEPLRLFSREKRYRCRFYSVDNVGNTEPVREIEFIVDTTPPTVLRKLESTAYGKTFSSHSVITLSTSDNNSGVKGVYYRFDDGNAGKETRYVKPLTSRALGSLPDGPHTLYYFAEDRVGNRGEIQKYSFYLDNTEPGVGFKILGDRHEDKGRVYVSRRSRVRLTAAKKAAGVKDIRYRIGTGPWNIYTAPFSLPIKPGPHTVSYHGIDRTGNTGPVHNKTLYLDLDEPGTAAVFRGPLFKSRGQSFISAGTMVELQAEDGETGKATIFYRLDGGRETIYKKPFKIAAAGPHTIAYYAANNVNNRPVAKTIRFHVDKKPPKLNITYNKTPVKEPGGLPVFPGGVLVYITARDEDSEVDKVTCSVNGGPAMLYRNPLTNFEPGKTIVLKAHAVDRLQNRTEVVIKFRVEATTKMK